MDKPDIWGIDADIIAYSVGFAADGDPVNYAIASARSMAQDIINHVGAEGFLYLTGKTNYRTTEADPEFPYKGNRADAKKPRHLMDIREYLIDQLGAIVSEGEEADDLLGIGAVQSGHGIATIDKDLLGVPGWHYNWRTGVEVEVSEEEANRFFYLQMLTGDGTDNIPGLYKRVGKKATKKVKEPLESMDSPAAMYEHVRQVYLDGYDEVGMCLDDKESVVDRWLLSQARCLWIRREPGELWEPPADG